MRGLDTCSAIRIVVADDHPVFRDALCRLLSLEDGIEVVAQARDGREALECVTHFGPEILLLDLNMPIMDGRGVLQELRNRKVRTRVIVLTASEERDDFLQAMQLGAAGVVLKREDTETLIKSIRRVNAGEIWVNPAATATVMRSPHVAHATQASQQWPPRFPLTFKELEVVKLVSRGLRNKDIGARMQISEQTVKNHLRNIFDKLHVGDRLELALYAIHNGLED